MSQHDQTESFRPDLFRSSPLALFASKCIACQRIAFPPREICPSCNSDGVPETKELQHVGELYSYTIVHQAPPGLPAPYMLGYVDLPDDGVRLLARLEGFDQGTLAIGASVRLAAAYIDGPDSGQLKFSFRPAKEELAP